MEYTIQKEELHVTEPIGWFLKLDELRTVGPGEVSDSDYWVVRDGDDIIAMALVSTSYARDADAHVFRIGVLPAYRRQGIADTLLKRLAEEYGSLELECRESLDANEFYSDTGWERTGVNAGDPEDLVQWRYEPSES